MLICVNLIIFSPVFLGLLNGISLYHRNLIQMLLTALNIRDSKEVNNKVSTSYFHVKFKSYKLTFSYCQIANGPNKDQLNDHEDFSSWIHPFVIPMATLGRDFFMGQLYNFVNHTIVTGTMTITIPWYME